MSIRGFDSFMKLVINECIKMAVSILEDQQQHTETNRINGRGRAMNRTDDRTKRKFQRASDKQRRRPDPLGRPQTRKECERNARHPGRAAAGQSAQPGYDGPGSRRAAGPWGGGGTTLKGLRTERRKLMLGSSPKFGWVSHSPGAAARHPEQAGRSAGGRGQRPTPPPAPHPASSAPPRLQRPHEPSVRLRKARPHSIWLLGARGGGGGGGGGGSGVLYPACCAGATALRLSPSQPSPLPPPAAAPPFPKVSE
ncbi:unnamed protein product [Nyctereutes procyonoides]|uniref:(raccoon dog) hypothetical protein n=1 Tax=Nyctereutes procyonoides TaxID=34880 RepID=A0A811ZS21_NYCPR|nr:unnamed protein product [Nyctereutes procyonoides]